MCQQTDLVSLLSEGIDFNGITSIFYIKLGYTCLGYSFLDKAFESTFKLILVFMVAKGSISASVAFSRLLWFICCNYKL